MRLSESPFALDLLQHGGLREEGMIQRSCVCVGVCMTGKSRKWGGVGTISAVTQTYRLSENEMKIRTYTRKCVF